jgi:sensor histidine kinase YesM
VDAEGTVLYSSDPASAGRTAEDLDLRMNGAPEASYYVERTADGVRMVVIGSPNSMGWRIVHQRPFPSLVGTFRTIRVLLYAVALLGFLMLAAYTLLYFQGMRRARLEVRNQEIEKLEAQISPHFLDNVLGNIKFMALLDRQERILGVVDPLIRLLHASLDGASRLIRLEEEMENLRHYVSIMEQLYENGIGFSYGLDRGLDDCLVPKFLLQPIVENAIYHGIDPGSGAGRIEVRSRRAGDGFLLEVEDNGVGFPKGRIEQVLGNGSLAPVSIGLWNTNRKIQLLFGARYGIDIDTGEGKGTVVTVRLPIRKRGG